MATKNSSTPNPEVEYTKAELDKVGILPWFSYSITLPLDPLPPIASRPPLETKNLIVRPLVPTDLEAFHKLRSDASAQNRSFARGAPRQVFFFFFLVFLIITIFKASPLIPFYSASLEETQAALDRLQSPFDKGHWYWGAFLRSTDELIGEGGLFDTEGLVDNKSHDSSFFNHTYHPSV